MDFFNCIVILFFMNGDVESIFWECSCYKKRENKKILIVNCMVNDSWGKSDCMVIDNVKKWMSLFILLFKKFINVLLLL